MNIWPIEIKPPLVDSFALAYRQREQLIQFQSTAQRQYRHSIEPGYKVTCQLLLTKAEMEVFRKWYIFDLGQGADWFTADWTIFIGRIDYPVKFTKPYESSNKGHLVMVGLDLMVASSLTPCESYPSEWPSKRVPLSTVPSSYVFSFDYHQHWMIQAFSSEGASTRKYTEVGSSFDSRGRMFFHQQTETRWYGEHIVLFRRPYDVFIKDDLVRLDNPSGNIETDAKMDQFGSSLSYCEPKRLLFVGASWYDAGSTTAHHGRVYIYSFDNNSFTLQQTIEPHQNILGANGQDGWMGQTVSISYDGKVLFIGSSRYTHDGIVNPGRVLVYDLSGSTYVYRTSIVYPPLGTRPEFGGGVASNHDGSRVFVTAREDINDFRVDEFGEFSQFARQDGDIIGLDATYPVVCTADTKILGLFENANQGNFLAYRVNPDGEVPPWKLYSTAYGQGTSSLSQGASMSADGVWASTNSSLYSDSTALTGMNIYKRSDKFFAGAPDCGGPTAP